MILLLLLPLQWRHNERDGVSNHRNLDWLLNTLFRRRSKKTSKLCVTGLCDGNFPHERPVAQKLFPFDYVTMTIVIPVLLVAMMYALVPWAARIWVATVLVNIGRFLCSVRKDFQLPDQSQCLEMMENAARLIFPKIQHIMSENMAILSWGEPSCPSNPSNAVIIMHEGVSVS